MTENGDEFRAAVEFGYYISEKYSIPVIIQAAPFEEQVGYSVEEPQIANRKSGIVNRDRGICQESSAMGRYTEIPV